MSMIAMVCMPVMVMVMLVIHSAVGLFGQFQKGQIARTIVDLKPKYDYCLLRQSRQRFKIPNNSFLIGIGLHKNGVNRSGTA
jgi:hypothetical protein